MAEEVLLNGRPLKVVQIIDLTESKEVVPSHKVEEGYDVSDHLINKPAEFQIQLEVEESDLEMIKQLYENKEATEFVCKVGVFEDVVVKELHITQGGSINTFRVTLHLKQILKAKSKTATISLPQLQVTPSEEQSKGGDTAVSPQPKQVPQAPEPPQENQSWLDSIVTFLGGILGFGA
jgi:hypothetical protein